ncbi:MAG: outer membrane protein assembly factor BamD [Chitinophagales bacterium]
MPLFNVRPLSLFARLRMPAVFVLTLLLLLNSCDTPEKVLKSPDLAYKEARARYWFEKKEYFKCIPVLEELIGLMKGRQSVEDLYYMYCMANYKQGDYMISAYHFKNFFDQYGSNPKAEECLYMYAKSYQQLSPKPSLDQTYTYKALEAYAFFLSMYPDSKFITETNTAVNDLRRKLERKALMNAELYFKTGNFKAAATSYENLLTDFPDIQENEKIGYMIIKANYKYALNSIPEKKAARFNHVIESYNDFKYKFPTSKYLEESRKYEQMSQYQAVKSAFEWADYTGLGDKDRAYAIAFNEAKKHDTQVKDEKLKADFAEWTEKGHFMLIKYAYQLGEEKRTVEKKAVFEKTVRNYLNFVDLFPNSRYKNEAEKLFNQANEQLKKLASHG